MVSALQRQAGRAAALPGPRNRGGTYHSTRIPTGLRQTEGFLGSVLKLMQLDLMAPDHTTLSRRGSKLEVALHRRPPAGPTHLIVDSAGRRIGGQDEWAAAKHGVKGIRRWRKLHVGVDADGVIVAEQLTDRATHDAAVVPGLLEQVDSNIKSFIADGAYDSWALREALSARGAAVVVPRSKRATESNDDRPASQVRDAAVVRIRDVGRRRWKKEASYH